MTGCPPENHAPFPARARARRNGRVSPRAARRDEGRDHHHEIFPSASRRRELPPRPREGRALLVHQNGAGPSRAIDGPSKNGCSRPSGRPPNRQTGRVPRPLPILRGRKFCRLSASLVLRDKSHKPSLSTGKRNKSESRRWFEAEFAVLDKRCKLRY